MTFFQKRWLGLPVLALVFGLMAGGVALAATIYALNKSVPITVTVTAPGGGGGGGTTNATATVYSDAACTTELTAVAFSPVLAGNISAPFSVYVKAAEIPEANVSVAVTGLPDGITVTSSKSTVGTAVKIDLTATVPAGVAAGDKTGTITFTGNYTAP